MRFLLLLWLLLLTGCAPAAEAALTPVATAGPVSLTLADAPLAITLDKPAGWYVYPAAEHLVLTEYETMLARDGRLRGIVLHVWAQATADGLTTAQVLQAALAEQRQQHALGSTVPAAFRWNGYDAAYYTLNSGDGNITLVLALTVPEAGHLVALNLSAPADQAQRLYAYLPQMMAALHINGVALTANAMQFLPQVLALPPGPAPAGAEPQSAMQASPPAATPAP
ncbi:MAG: hypothetical protein MUE40_14635 [Anaerolineae bacterium]|jgi:hypothetical protein|nr:hypothetical protein [Anaerolineae bacterium]